jgi:hypothetical protein
MPKEYALDLMFAYTVEEAYLALGSLDWENRDLYRLGIWALDMPYMAIYSLLFSGILLKLWNNKKVIWLPFSIFFMDLLENLMVLRMLKVFPREDQYLAIFSSIFSTSKWIMVAVLIGIIVIGLLSSITIGKYSPLDSQKAEI